MTYLPGIPLSTDLQSVSQGQIQTNFTQIGTIFAANHYALDYATVALRGMHQFVTLEDQAAAPATSATQVAVYAKSDGANPQLYFRRASSGTEIKMTSSSTPVASNPGASFLPGGVLCQWGLVVVSGGSVTVNFPVSFAGTPWSVVVTPYNISGIITMASENFTAASFKIYCSSTFALSASWVAFGPAS